MRLIYLTLFFLAISLTTFAQNFNVDFNPTGAMLCPGGSQQFGVTINGGGSAPFTYIWSGDGTNDTIVDNYSSSHTVTIANTPIGGLYYLNLNVKVFDLNGDSAENVLNIRVNNDFYIDITKDLPIDTYHLTTSDPLLNIEQVNYSISPDLFSLSEISTWHWDVGTYGNSPHTETLALSLSIPFLDRPCENRDFDIFFLGNNKAGCKLTAYQHMNILNSIPDPPDHFYPHTFTFPFKRDAIDTIDLTPYYNPATCWGLPGHISDVDLSLYGSQSGGATFDGLKVFFNPLNNICDNFSINVKVCLDPPYDNICSGFFDVPIMINCPLIQQVSIDSLKQKNVSCNGRNDGSVEIFLRGTPPFHIKWYDYYNLLIDTTFMNSSLKISNLSANQYSLDYDDSGLFFGTQYRPIFITEPAPLKIDSIYTTPSSCSGICKGSASLSLSGGTPAYSYVWSSGFGTVNSSLCAGSYTVTITDANACTTSSAFTIPTIGNNQLNVTIQGDTLNCRHTNATLTAIPSGGQGSYSFLWSSGDATASIQSTSTSPFSVNVHDSINCGSATFDLISTAKTISLSGVTTAGSCNAQVNIGTAKIIPSGGTAPYSYLWNTSPNQITQQATALSNGNHNVTVTDIDSCIAVKQLLFYLTL